MSDIKEYLDSLVEKYENESFIKDDPIQFPHRFNILQDIEISGFLASALAYGKREAFIEKLNYLHKIFGHSPYDFCMNYDEKRDFHFFEDFVYRFNKGKDISIFIKSIQNFYKKHVCMKDFVENSYKKSNCIKKVIEDFSDEISSLQIEKTKGFEYLVVSPKLNSPCKRINLLFRWMVRKSDVDLGVWQNIDKKHLIIPLDTHVAKVSRELNLVSRTTNDWKCAEIITEKLRSFDETDPIKYDFALFGVGVTTV